MARVMVLRPVVFRFLSPVQKVPRVAQFTKEKHNKKSKKKTSASVPPLTASRNRPDGAHEWTHGRLPITGCHLAWFHDYLAGTPS